jgi:hypothetical protein
MTDDDEDDVQGAAYIEDADAWRYQPPRLHPGHGQLTLALLEDLSRLLIVHGYPPLRGRSLAELVLSLQRIDDGED